MALRLKRIYVVQKDGRRLGAFATLREAKAFGRNAGGDVLIEEAVAHAGYRTDTVGEPTRAAKKVRKVADVPGAGIVFEETSSVRRFTPEDVERVCSEVLPYAIAEVGDTPELYALSFRHTRNVSTVSISSGKEKVSAKLSQGDGSFTVDFGYDGAGTFPLLLFETRVSAVVREAVRHLHLRNVYQAEQKRRKAARPRGLDAAEGRYSPSYYDRLNRDLRRAEAEGDLDAMMAIYHEMGSALNAEGEAIDDSLEYLKDTRYDELDGGDNHWTYDTRAANRAYIRKRMDEQRIYNLYNRKPRGSRFRHRSESNKLRAGIEGGPLGKSKHHIYSKFII